MRSGRNETKALRRPISGQSPVSEVRIILANPFETKRNFDAHWGCVGVCDRILAEGKVLAANSLPVEVRSPWGDCGNWRSGSLTQDCDLARRAEPRAIHPPVVSLGSVTFQTKRPVFEA
jgi:hypothetical protein